MQYMNTDEVYISSDGLIDDNKIDEEHVMHGDFHCKCH